MSDPYPPVDICCGGTIPVGQNYVPFVNSTGAPQSVSNCALFGGARIAVPATTGSSYNVPIAINPLPRAGSYSYTASCNCPMGTGPQIKVQ